MNKYYLGSAAGEFLFVFSKKSKDRIEKEDDFIFIDANPSQILKTIFRKINIENNIEMSATP